MIRFVVARPHSYTVKPLLSGSFGAETPPCEALFYDELFASPRLKAGTYVFCDIERLSDNDLIHAAAVYKALWAAGLPFRVINDPAQVKFRYALLRALHERDLNCFDAYRADGQPRPKRFPVFIREEAAHELAGVDLLKDQEALEAALKNLPLMGRPLRGLIVIEFCAEPVSPGVFRRYGTFRIGNGVQLDNVVTEELVESEAGKAWPCHRANVSRR